MNMKTQAKSEGKVTRHFERARRRAAAVLCAVVLLVGAGCSDDPEPVFAIPGTGSVEGLLFLDTDQDGRYDPSAGDRLLPDVNVRLLARGTDQVLAGSDAQTDASGRFTISNVAVGTHELSIDTTGIGAGVFFCQNPIPVSVFLNESFFQTVAARGGCVITIAEAEALAPGSPVTLLGRVTSTPGQLGTGRMYIEDATGGVRVTNLNTGGATLAIGDLVEVSGVIGLISGAAGEMEVTAGRLNSQTTLATPLDTAIVTSGAITTAAQTSAADPLLGTLVTVRKASLTAIWGEGQPSTRNASFSDGSGVAVLRVESSVISFPNASDVVPGLSAIIGLGKCYDITGIATNFGSVGQLTPRTLADIVEVPCS
jgi:hypothetical protein